MRLYGYGRIFVKTVSILLLVVLTVVMTGFSKQEAKVQNHKLTLEVALFPYVPDRVRFQEAVSDALQTDAYAECSLPFAGALSGQFPRRHLELRVKGAGRAHQPAGTADVLFHGVCT